VKTYVMNKYGTFCLKIFLHYIDIAIFASGYFILPHPVGSLRDQSSGAIKYSRSVRSTIFGAIPNDHERHRI